MIPPFNQKRGRDDEPEPEIDDDDGPIEQPPTKRRREATVPPQDVNDDQQGQVLAADRYRWYGFVESVTQHEAPVRVGRRHRGDPVAAVQQAPTRVSVVFDCLAAEWFDNQVPYDLNIAWDTVSVAASSCRAEILLNINYFNLMNQRQSPVSGLPLPVIEEGSWWELRLDATADPANIAVLLTVPYSDNPVSTILSPRNVMAGLVDLTVPKQLIKLIRFSHGWGVFGPGPNDPPYPGR